MHAHARTHTHSQNSEEYKQAMQSISKIVDNHRNTMKAGDPQLNYCDRAVMVSPEYFFKQNSVNSLIKIMHAVEVTTLGYVYIWPFVALRMHGRINSHNSIHELYVLQCPSFFKNRIGHLLDVRSSRSVFLFPAAPNNYVHGLINYNNVCMYSHCRLY